MRRNDPFVGKTYNKYLRECQRPTPENADKFRIT